MFTIFYPCRWHIFTFLRMHIDIVDSGKRLLATAQIECLDRQFDRWRCCNSTWNHVFTVDFFPISHALDKWNHYLSSARIGSVDSTFEWNLRRKMRFGSSFSLSMVKIGVLFLRKVVRAFLWGKQHHQNIWIIYFFQHAKHRQFSFEWMRPLSRHIDVLQKVSDGFFSGLRLVRKCFLLTWQSLLMRMYGLFCVTSSHHMNAGVASIFISIPYLDPFVERFSKAFSLLNSRTLYAKFEWIITEPNDSAQSFSSVKRHSSAVFNRFVREKSPFFQLYLNVTFCQKQQ